MQHALIQRERINEGLERGTGRALGQHAVHLAVDALVPVIGRAHPCLDRHIAESTSRRRGVADAAVAKLIDVAVDLPFHQTLQPGIERGVNPAGAARPLAQQRIDEMRRQLRHSKLRWRFDGRLDRRGVAGQPLGTQSLAGFPQARFLNRPACAAAGRCGITASVSASPTVSREAVCRSRSGWRPDPWTLPPKGARFR